jgi:UMF1 family MFS transporter
MIDDVVTPTPIAARPAAGESAALGRGGWSWILFECGMIPQLLLISGFVFMPYFATVVVGKAVHGQSLLAMVQTCVGLVVAITAPLLGATVDRWGARKPWLAAAVVAEAVILASLWWAKPGGAGLPIQMILVLIGCFTGLYAYMGMLFNSMLPIVVSRQQTAKASGYGLASANTVGVIVLVGVLWALTLPGKLALPFLPAHPLFGLDPAQYEPARIAGPIGAAILLLFCLPLFMFAPDAPRTGLSVAASVRGGISELRSLVRQARGTHRNLATFLMARIAYGDAVASYIGFGGIFAAGVMGWRGAEMLVLGIITTASCGAGALIGQALDRTIGPRRAVMIELLLMSGFILAQIGMGRDRILYMPYDRAAHGPVWSGPFFTHAPDVVFLVISMGVAMTLVASGSSSRTLMVRLTPRAQMGTIFGIAALTTSATSWLAPLGIKIFTDTWNSQQAGFFPLLILLMVGLVGMLFVRGGGRVVDELESGDHLQ